MSNRLLKLRRSFLIATCAIVLGLTMPRYSCCSKQIEFGVMAPSEMVQASEVQIYERTLYKVPCCTFPGGDC